MLVPLRPAAGGEPATWAMIELQGEIERKEGGSQLGPFDVGTICASDTVSSPGGAAAAAPGPTRPVACACNPLGSPVCRGRCC